MGRISNECRRESHEAIKPEEKKKAFKEKAETIVNQIIDKLDELSKLNRAAYYTYTDEDLKKISGALQINATEALKKLQKKEGRRFVL